MGKRTNTGTIVRAVASQPATFDEAGYGALTFVKVGEVLSVGTYGAEYDEVTSQPLETGVTEGFKGFVSYGKYDIGLERDVDDLGQAVLADLADGANKFAAGSLEIEHQDGSIDYLDVRVFSYTTDIGSANSMVGSVANIRVNRKPVEVAAP